MGVACFRAKSCRKNERKRNWTECQVQLNECKCVASQDVSCMKRNHSERNLSWSVILAHMKRNLSSLRGLVAHMASLARQQSACCSLMQLRLTNVVFFRNSWHKCQKSLQCILLSLKRRNVLHSWKPWKSYRKWWRVTLKCIISDVVDEFSKFSQG